MLAIVWAEIWTQNLQNMNLQYCTLTDDDW